jgi:hypothetical protein
VAAAKRQVFRSFKPPRKAEQQQQQQQQQP